jgi:hypothetical protein
MRGTVHAIQFIDIGQFGCYDRLKNGKGFFNQIRPGEI